MKLGYNWNLKNPNKLIYVGHADPYPEAEIKRHHHPCNEMVILIKGSISVEVLKKNIFANPGDILNYPAGISHKEHLTSTTPAEIFYFAWKEKKEKGKTEIPILTHDTNKKIRFLAQWLYEEKELVSPYRSLLQEKIFEVILIELKKISKSKESHPMISSLRSFMKEHLKERLNLEKLAEYIGVSKYHFLRTYKKLTGRTPMDDLRIIRAETAKDMLFTTDSPLKAISKEVGFADEYQLSKVFRKQFGTPPGQFRRNKSFL
ncbi:MAG: helix-turn-helix domain-containing protein [Elusimicrobia bacterium]|nr:helix-turn-helix domain-containing protein [Elusimicrobiota bacterium]